MPTLLVVAAAIPIIYIVAPLLHILTNTDWSHAEQLLADTDFQGALFTSVTAACCSTLAAVVLGLPTAYYLSVTSFFGKPVIEGLLLLPLVLPPVVGGMSLLSTFGPDTALGSLFAGLGLPLTNSILGVVIAQFYITSPFVILSAKAGFDEVPRELKEAVQIDGGGTWHIFWNICIPSCRSAIAAGTALTFARAIGEFGATMIVAYHPYTIPVDIWVAFTSGGLDTIVPITAVITLFTASVTIIGAIGRRFISRTIHMGGKLGR
ncbi:ABC transporter permease subunit [Alicyclobacillus dauci]|uniref:ABC transporter permease subunit n=1 Tax=Alicyclobacillus dauci TaxID=1475485 RepID=A0ABY6Z5L1_9BACL|nr:ABC transporter permease subunit [Alicyclobacillus dauci]WAH38172.1 ABC transporter permease subunit [Alicyclobacillus dauci]